MNYVVIDMEWKQTEDTIKVKMTAVYVTDSYIDENSGRVYLEEESVFAPITLEKLLAGFFRKHDKYDGGCIQRGSCIQKGYIAC
ncbi:MAG: DUF4230 domain-containing protein [Bacillota bacterium]|nr:DUF4230 domain-containing protein [Bacillota bacterium]